MWNVVQCAAQGTGHSKQGIPCQDKTFFLEKDGSVAIALADGAGSAAYSQYGAEVITSFTCDCLVERFNQYYKTEDVEKVKSDLIGRIRNRLLELSRQINCEIRELASTLLVVVVKGENFILMHIGDGVIGYLQENEIRVASYPENGEFANTTVFTTSSDAIISMRLIREPIGKKKAFVLMSDGTENSLYDKRNKTIASSLRRVMYRIASEGPVQLQKQLQHSCETLLRSRTTDDCSLVIMVNDGLLPPYCEMSVQEKCRLFSYSADLERRVQKCDAILSFCKRPRTGAQISRFIHVKEKYMDKFMDPMIKTGLIERIQGKYQSVVP